MFCVTPLRSGPANESDLVVWARMQNYYLDILKLVVHDGVKLPYSPGRATTLLCLANPTNAPLLKTFAHTFCHNRGGTPAEFFAIN